MWNWIGKMLHNDLRIWCVKQITKTKIFNFEELELKSEDTCSCHWNVIQFWRGKCKILRKWNINLVAHMKAILLVFLLKIPIKGSGPFWKQLSPKTDVPL